MWHDLAVAACLLLVLEGMMPFLSPGGWRQMVQQIAMLSERNIRLMGLASMLLGAILLGVLR